MLRGLRRKFVIIVMALVGSVLVVGLGSSFYSAYRTQQTLVAESLEHCMRRGTVERLMLGERPHDDDDRMYNLLSLCVDVSSDGIVIGTSDAPVSINADVLSSVVEQVVSGEQTEGTDRGAHIAWTSTVLGTGGWRIAIADTSATESLLREQALHDIVIVVLALAALFAISWWLSDWALRPVQLAWDQQRRFVADASHELKTPLAVILANLQILQADDGLDDDARRWVESTEDEAQHMKALVGDLLQLARADETVAGGAQSAMRHEDVDLSELVESCSLEFDALAFERGCSIEEHVEQGVHVSGDPTWLGRLVRILIDNACKYADPGTSVDVTLATRGSKATYSVHNLGTPIDPEDLPHVFERFYRSDKARSREDAGGFGLGLAIAKSIAEAHGGTIAVTSTTDEGTTFTVTL